LPAGDFVPTLWATSIPIAAQWFLWTARQQGTEEVNEFNNVPSIPIPHYIHSTSNDVLGARPQEYPVSALDTPGMAITSSPNHVCRAVQDECLGLGQNVTE
jgi:hypothetical protein